MVTKPKPAPAKESAGTKKVNQSVSKAIDTAAIAGKSQSSRTPVGNQSIGRVGNLGSDPELRFSASGLPVCNVSLAYTPYNFETKEQGETVWYRCIGFGPLAEQMANNLQTGMRVLAIGRPQLNEWTNDEGVEHSIKEILLDAIGPDIRFANVSVSRNARRGANTVPGNDPSEDYEEPF